MNGKRIELLDGLRGLAVCLMVLHHLMYDLVILLGAPVWLFTCGPIDFLHSVFATLFIVLCGICSNFSRSNLKRGLKAAAISAAITLVTCLMDMDILWGVLHLLSFCMICVGISDLAEERWPHENRPIWVKLLLDAVFIIAALLLGRWLSHVACCDGNVFGRFILFILGPGKDYFVTYDYFPIFPWLLVFAAGVLIGKPIQAGKFPKWFYNAKMPGFSAVGKHSLIIYVVHQPLLFGIVWLIGKLIGTV